MAEPQPQPPIAGNTPPSSATASPASTIGGEHKTTAAELGAFYDDLKRYLEAEVQTQAEEWDFLQKCNEVTVARYRALAGRANQVIERVNEAQQQMEHLPEYVADIEKLERSVEVLETIAKGIDTYSKQLEQRFVP